MIRSKQMSRDFPRARLQVHRDHEYIEFCFHTSQSADKASVIFAATRGMARRRRRRRELWRDTSSQ